MQTTINADMAVGIPGEFATTRPRYAYAVETSAAVTFGEPVIFDSTTLGANKMGRVKPATGATCDGVAASPHQHVQNALPSSEATLTVPAGTVISIVERGEIFIKVPAEVATVTEGGKLYVASGKWAATGTTAVGTILKSGVAGDVIPVRIGF